MPYADEHSCRLIAPSEFEEFRRQNNYKQIDGKRVDAIFGVTEGGLELQAIRYPKSAWSSAEARSQCSANDGIMFEPAVSPQIREEKMSHRSKFIRPEVKVIDKSAGLITAIVSTESVDRDGDIIRQAHWDLNHFKSHPILLSSHNYRGLQNQIGEWTAMGVSDNKLVGEAKYYIKEGNPEADWGFKLASKGRAAFSVGFVPDMSRAKALEVNGNMAYEFNGQELLEVSQVTVPSNADALQQLKGFGIHPELEAIVTEIIDEMDVKEQVSEIAEQPSLIQAEFDYEALAREVSALLRDDLRMLIEEQVEKNSPKPTKTLPTAEDIVKRIIADYREVR
tara:strand:+ start:1060 stop:2070 length:1011 start_codon:yes stop_codon:yes gene_type:complete